MTKEKLLQTFDERQRLECRIGDLKQVLPKHPQFQLRPCDNCSCLHSVCIGGCCYGYQHFKSERFTYTRLVEFIVAIIVVGCLLRPFNFVLVVKRSTVNMISKDGLICMVT